MREVLVIACLLAGTVAGDRVLDLRTRPREGRIGVGSDSRYSQPLGPFGQQNRRVLELGNAEDPGNYVYVEDLEEFESNDAPGLDFTYGDAVEGYVPDSYSAAPSYADPSLLSQVMHQAEQANFRFPAVTTKPPRTDLDTAASSLDGPETNEINPFSLFPPQFHQLLNIPLHVYKNGSTYNPHSNHKNSPRVPVIHQGYANTNVHGGSSYKPSRQNTPVVAYRPKPVYAPKRPKIKPTISPTTSTTTTEKPRKPTYVHVQRTTTSRPTVPTTTEKITTTPKPTTTEKPRPITKPEVKPTKISRLPALRYTRRPVSQTTTPKPFTPFEFSTSRPVLLAPTRNNVPDIQYRPRPESRPVIIPETRHPVTIKTQRPLVTETSQPEILNYDAPETSRPFIPETRRPIIPETNRPFVPETRRPLTPETHRPFIPDTRRPVVPETKIPLTSRPQNEDTKEESKPKPFIPSKLDPFSNNPPQAPLPAPIRPEFENGPESLPPVVNTFNDVSEPKTQPPVQIRPIAPAPGLLPVADALVTYPPAPLNPTPSPINLPSAPLVPPPAPINAVFNLPPNRPQPPQGQDDFLVRPLHINAIRPPPPLPQRPIFPPAPLGNPTPPPPRPEQPSNNNPWASRPLGPDVRPPPFRVIPPASSSQIPTQNRPIVKNSDSAFTLPNEAENLPPVRNINNNSPPRLQNPAGPNVLPQFRPNAPPQRENFRITETPSRRRVYRVRNVRPNVSKRPSFLERFNFFGGSEPVNRRKGETGVLIDTNSATNKVPKKPEVVVPQYKLPSDVLQGNAQKVVVLGPYDRPPPGAPIIKLPDSSLAPPPSVIPAASSNPPTPPHLIRSNQKPSINKKDFRTPTVLKKHPVASSADLVPPPFQPQPLVQSDSKRSSISSDNIKNVKKPSSAVVYGTHINPETYVINSNKAETKVSSNFKVINMKNKEQHIVTPPSAISGSITRSHKPQVTVEEVSDEDKAAIIAGRINLPPSIERSDQLIVPFPVPIFNPPFLVKQKLFRPVRPVALHRQGQAAQRRVISVDAPTQQNKLKSPPKPLRRPVNGRRPSNNGPATFMRPPPPPPKNPLHPKPFSVRVPPKPSLSAKHPIPPPPPKRPPPPSPVRHTASQSTSSSQSPVIPSSKKPVYSKINTSVQDSPRPVYVRPTTMKPITTTKKQPEPISVITSAQTVPSIITERSTPMRVTEYNPYGTQKSRPHTPSSFKEPIIPEASYGGWKVVGAPSVPKEGESLSPVVGYVKENTPEIIIKSDLVENDHSDIVTGIASDRMGVAAPDDSDLVHYSSRLTIEAPHNLRSYWVNPPKHIN